MTMTEYEYHIYSNKECIYHSLSESQFQVTWEMLNSMVGTGTELSEKANFTYEKVSSGIGGHRTYDKEPEGSDSY